jgi:hypothetical protein
MEGNVFIWIAIVVFVGTIVTLISGMIYVSARKKEMNQNWPTYKCKPYVLPFAGILVGPPGTSPTSNFTDCMWTMHKSFFGVLMEPVMAILQMLVEILANLQGDIQNIRKMTTYLRDSVESIAKDIYQKVYDAYARIAALFAVIMATFNKLFAYFQSMFDIMLFIYYTFMSLWNGPVGGMLRFFCFHPDTYINLSNGSKKQIKHININDNIEFGGKVRAVLKFNALRTPLYQYTNPNNQDEINSTIFVSGTHWVLENQKWKQVKDSPYGVEIPLIENPEYIYCLITENNFIRVGKVLFKDYEEKNQLTNWIYKTISDYLKNPDSIDTNNTNNQLIAYDNELREKSEYFGSYFHGMTLVKMNDGSFKNMKDILIGEKLWNNNEVYATIQGDAHYCSWYFYNHELITSYVMLYDLNEYIKNIPNVRRITLPHNTNHVYSLITADKSITTSNGKYRDFEITADRNIQDYIDSVVNQD